MSYSDTHGREIPHLPVGRRRQTEPDENLKTAIQNAIKSKRKILDTEILKLVKGQGHNNITREHIAWVRNNAG
jgi:hypothetical protein